MVMTLDSRHYRPVVKYGPTCRLGLKLRFGLTVYPFAKLRLVLGLGLAFYPNLPFHRQVHSPHFRVHASWKDLAFLLENFQDLESPGTC